jgi:hypothetical protein
MGLAGIKERGEGKKPHEDSAQKRICDDLE